MKTGLLAAAGLAVFALCLLATHPTADASSFGITGWSGADGGDCSTCHSGGPGTTPPQVAIMGNAIVEPSETVAYMLAITSTTPAIQTIAGWDLKVADSDNDVAGTISGFDPTVGRLEFGEFTHTAPPPANNANGAVVVAFDWTAPSEPGTYTMYVAANSANGDGSNGPGDAGATTTFEVTVAVPTRVQGARGSAETHPPAYLWLIPMLLLPPTIRRLRHR